MDSSSASAELLKAQTLDELKNKLDQEADYSEWASPWVHIRGANKTVIQNLETDAIKLPSDFNTSYNEKVLKVGTNRDGTPKLLKYTTKWLADPERKRVGKPVFDPTLPTGFVPYAADSPPDPYNNGQLNLWPGIPDYSTLAYAAGTREARRVRRSWGLFWRGLFGEHWLWVALWVAHMLHYPEQRTSQAVMLTTSVEGIGKSLAGEFIIALLRAVGDSADSGKGLGMSYDTSRLGLHFNALMEAKIFIMVNELSAKFNNQEGQIRDMITADEYLVERKNHDAFSVINRRRFYFTTNSSSPIRMGKGQRRILIITPPRTYGDTRGRWGRWIGTRIADLKKDPKALGTIRQWFDELWAEHGEGRWNPAAPVPLTQEGEDIADGSDTTNGSVAKAMTQWVKEQGWAAVGSDELLRHKTIWNEVRAEIRAQKGRTGSLRYNANGKEVTCAFLAFDQKAKSRMKPKLDKNGHSKGWLVEGFAGQQEISSMVAVTMRMEELTRDAREGAGWRV